MNLTENIRIALSSLKSNFLRAVLTLLIIAVGIACLVGILTAIDTLLNSMSSSFNRMGANSFSVRPARNEMQSRGRGRQRVGEVISFDQAMQFKERYDHAGAKVSINFFCKWNATVKSGREETNPNVRLVGIDDNYLATSSYTFAAGRNFSPTEINNGDHKVIIGHDICKSLFDGNSEKALGQMANVDNKKYRIIGVLDPKGSSMTTSNDRRVFIPVQNAKRYHGTAQTDYRLTAAIPDPIRMDDAMASATGLLRNIRRLKAREQNDFEITSSSGLADQLKEMTTELRVATIAIVMMTLLGAAIGLMNIMLVSVTERTREIGVRKALGATRSNILFQFLMEAVVITMLGGLVGIILGVAVGVGVAAWAKGTFVMPYNWIALAIFVCIVVGSLSGLYPALKASRLDPIESLRYE